MIGLEAVDDARDAVFDQRHIEVDQQAKPLVRENQIRQTLLLLDRTMRRMNAESGVGNLLGNGVVGYSSLLLFLAKAPRRKGRNDGLRLWLRFSRARDVLRDEFSD